jgi:hypothetical protein
MAIACCASAAEAVGGSISPAESISISAPIGQVRPRTRGSVVFKVGDPIRSTFHSHIWIGAVIAAVLRLISSFLPFKLYCDGVFGYQALAWRHAVAFFGIETAAWLPQGPPP